MKTHWLYGRGPNKKVIFKVEIEEETLCKTCIHTEVCDHNVQKRCSNFEFGTSEYNDCNGCTHRFTRYDKDPIPCFCCNWYKEL